MLDGKDRIFANIHIFCNFSDIQIFVSFQSKVNHKISYPAKTKQITNIRLFHHIRFVSNPNRNMDFFAIKNVYE